MIKNILYPKNYINTLTRNCNIMSLASLAERKIFNSAPDFPNSIISPPGYLATTGTRSPPPPHPSTQNIITDFHHIKLFTGSANATKDLFMNKLNFKLHSFSSPETGNKETLNYLLINGNMKIIITTPLGNETYTQRTMNNFLSKHGDGIGDITFLTNDIHQLQKKMLQNNNIITNDLETYDNYKSITYQAHKTHSNLTHTFIETNRKSYNDILFDSYRLFNKPTDNNTIMDLDHVVINVRENEMNQTTNWYKNNLDFHQFWSVDDNEIYTEYSSLKSKVMTNKSETVKIPINEPAKGIKESQIQEFINQYNGPGIQHVALKVPNIIESVSQMKKNGLNFLKSPPDSYYQEISEKLKVNNIEIKEDINLLKSLGILIDCDENGYLLQIFTECIVDRPTLFFEIIQRENHNGFGAGNFKSLFKTIENSQEKRGNLISYQKPIDKFPNILGLHHYAYKCKNLNETINFYQNILNLPYVHRIDQDYVPSTGKYDPYSHIFFQLKDGSHIAFFDTKDNEIAKYNCADWINHISFNVESIEDLNKAKEKLIENNIEVIGPTKHGNFITSIYFFDPNGLRLELTYQHASLQELKKYKSKLNDIIHH